jgi:hypothetical protein
LISGRKAKDMKTLMVMMCSIGLCSLCMAQEARPTRVNPSDAMKHIGETASVCGKVVDTKVTKYGIAGHGKPVSLDLDQPEPNPVFFFVAFGTPPAGPQEVVEAYKGKRVCVTGKIDAQASRPPFIMAADRGQIKIEEEKK